MTILAQATAEADAKCNSVVFFERAFTVGADSSPGHMAQNAKEV